MRWQGRRQSSNIEDRRGLRISKKAGIGGGIGTIIIALLIILFGGDPSEILYMLQGNDNRTEVVQDDSYSPSSKEQEMAEFIAVVLADTEDVWNELFRQSGLTYREPKLVLFNGGVESACGYAQSATGPFYCPGDEKVYIDLDFLDELQRKLGAQGDFAAAYIIAHEVGHHVQNLLGTLDQGRSNEQSVRVELNADFLAGIWAHYAQKTKNILESGDLEEAMNAAQAVGDDRIQMRSQGYVVPDSFTHGTSEQRQQAFLLGYKSGDPSQMEI
jgi:hypothetical protein